MDPKISVIMTAYNEEKYIGEAIESILNQTFSNFELIIVNDGSTDNTNEIVESFNDSRIIILNNDTNLGTAASANKALKVASGEYIARADADDIYHPDRFARQLEIFEKKPEINMCGSWIELLYQDGRKAIIQYRKEDEYFKSFILFGPHIAHATLMIKRSVIEKQKIFYNENYLLAEDYEWYSRLFEHVKVYNIQEVLMTYRIHKNGLTQKRKELFEAAGNVRRKMLAKLNVEYSEKEFYIHQVLSGYKMTECITVEEVLLWLDKLKRQNELMKIFQEPYFSEVLAYQLLKFCEQNIEESNIWKSFFDSEYSQYITLEESTINLQKLVSYLIRNKIHDIAIFGTSRMGRFLYQKLSKNNFNIIYYIDNDPEMNNKILDNLPVINSNQLKKSKLPDAIIVSVLGEHDKQIISELQSSLQNNKIIILSWKEFD